MSTSRAPVFIKRLLAFALLWWLLTDGNLENWPLAALVIVLSAGLSAWFAPAASWSISGLGVFLPFFLWHSMKGGIDVAFRTFRRSLPLDPSVVSYPVRLSPESARLFFANTINLLPGTLCADIEGDTLSVHVLDAGGNFQRELEALEHRIAQLFNVPLSSNSGGKYATL